MTPSAPNTVLVTMPWASAARPSIGIGLLVSLARRAGFRCDAFYPNLYFSSLFDPVESYEQIAAMPKNSALAEHLFAVDVFGREALGSDEYLRGIAEDDGSGSGPDVTPDALDLIQGLRDDAVPAFLSYCLDALLARAPDVVGFGCTCGQLSASLALATRIKQARPDTVVIFGGTAVHDEMGEALARLFPGAIDHVFTGEGGREATRLLLDPIESLAFMLADRAIPLARLQQDLRRAFPRQSHQVGGALHRLAARGILLLHREKALAVVPFQDPLSARDVSDWIASVRPRGPAGRAARPAPRDTSPPLATQE